MLTRESYEQLRSTFSLDVPPRFNYVRDVVDRWASSQPDKLALIAVEPDGITANRYTFTDISTRASTAADLLAELGVEKGDRVFVMLPRTVEWYDVLLGCIRLGAIPMPATMQLTAKDIAYRIKKADASVAITDGEGFAAVAAALGECPAVNARIIVGEPRSNWTSYRDAVLVDRASSPVEDTASDDPMLIYFTSGTESYPKMVLHTQASYGIGHEITARFWHDLDESDVHWTVSDTGWAKAAWGKLFGQWRLGAAVLMWNIIGKPDFDRMLRIIGEQGVTTLCAPPTLYRAFAQMDLSQYELSGLRHSTAAGEPLNPEVIKVWHNATGLQIYDGYGQTETVNIVANLPGIEVRPGSMGLPTPGFDVQIVDDAGNIVNDGDEGNIAVRIEPERPVGLFKEYWRDPEKNAQVFRNGWYLTGDRATRDRDGYIWFVGRADDVILSAAYRIGPFEVESALLEHEAVAEAAVVGRPDPARGEIVKAFVILADGFLPTAELGELLKEHVKATTAPYKYPREIEFVDELPKTVSGKIRRVELRGK
ncbi:acyl-CoA synthetase [Candidatus Poriferisocius sp.]|uniref:acyl-CoA synthetase n=1 Tax=Candidatus Poriferisocius sp. TaxID=3101276 RepID=UPI003B018077